MAITDEQLKGAYSEGEALAIYREVRQKDDFLAFACRFMHHRDYQVARNALWGLTKATDEELSALRPVMNDLIDLAMNHANSSVRRLSMNVLERLDMTEDDLRSDFFNYCLEHMARPDEYPGIQSLSMKLAYRMACFYPELMAEFLTMVKAMQPEYYSPAVNCVRTRILRDKYKDRRGFRPVMNR